ncbi:MAG: FlgD immunoglobulin-like domain containing protein, partial [bacterium]|nr:FlgD immunoglobulin-like domain containing protein [bacterium]
FGTDIRIEKENRDLETWGYFNHSIGDKLKQPYAEILNTTPFNCTEAEDYIYINVSGYSMNLTDCSLDKLYFCGYLTDNRINKMYPLLISDDIDINKYNDYIGYIDYCMINNKDILKIPVDILDSGNYEITLMIQDSSGASSVIKKEIFFYFEDKPAAEITYPERYAVVDIEETGNLLNITGTANLINPAYDLIPPMPIGDYTFNYYLYYSYFDTPQNKIIFGNGHFAVEDGILGHLDVSAMGSGKYNIHLNVVLEDFINNLTFQREINHPFLIDKEHPSAELTSLQDGDILHNTTVISGDAYDPNFISYIISFRKSGEEGFEWVPLTGEIMNEKHGENLAVFDSNIFEDGFYEVKLTVRDAADKVSEDIKFVRIFNEPVDAVLFSDRNSFSPNGDSCNDYIVFTSTSENMDNIQSSRLEVRDSSGILVRTVNVSDITSAIIWDGKDSLGSTLPEGLYICTLYIISVNGITYPSNQEIVSLSLTDDVINIYNEKTVITDSLYNIQADYNPAYNKILYLKTNAENLKEPLQLPPCYYPYVLSSNCSIWEKDLVTGSEEKLINSETQPPFPAPYPYPKLFMTKKPRYSPDGSKFMFIRAWKLKQYQNGIITDIQKQDGTKPVILDYAWNPQNSSQFAYIEEYSYPQKLMLSDNNIHQELFSGKIKELAWSNNGNYIIFIGNIQDSEEDYIFTYNLTTWSIVSIYGLNNICHSLCLSPDSKKAAFVSRDSFGFSQEIIILYLTPDGNFDNSVIGNPVQAAPSIEVFFQNSGFYETFGWTNDGKWLKYGLVTDVPMVHTFDTGLEDIYGHRLIYPGTPEYWKVTLQAVNEYGYNRHIIEDNIKILPYSKNLSPSSNWTYQEKIGGGRPFFLENTDSFICSRYQVRTADILESDFLRVSTCISVEGNVPGTVISYDGIVSASVGHEDLDLPIDTLMITPIILPVSSPASDMSDIQPVIGEVYDVKLISNQPEFNEYAVLTFSYTDTQTVNIDESSINIYTFNENLQEWVPAQTNPELILRDYENNTVSILTPHLSLYVLSGKVQTVDAPAITVFSVLNNPFSPNSDGIKDNCIFSVKTNQDSTVHLTVYMTNGTQVIEKTAEVPENTSVSIPWDGKNYTGNIQSDGKYNVEVYAVNSENLRSSNIVSNIYLDTTPPYIIINNVQDGGIYNTDISPVITVIDMFPDTIGILLNNLPFISGSVISNEGNYSLNVYASDTAGNAASEQTGFLLDKTPPVSEMSLDPFRIENGKIMIVPETDFTVNSTDAGNPPSGVILTEFKVINENYYDSGWINYIEPFTLGDFEKGEWTLLYRSIDAAGNIEQEKELKVVSGDVFDDESSNVTSGTVCLIWITDDEFTFNSPEIIKLKEILDGFFVYYKLVLTKEEFIDEFRTNQYHVYFILGGNSNLGKLPSAEFKEHIKLGRGVVSSGFHNFTGEGNESELFGIKVNGKTVGETHTITIENSLISNSEVLTVSGELEKIEITGPFTEQFAYYEVDGSSYPAITVCNYGEGKAVYFGFDLLDIRNLSNEKTAELTGISLDYVRKAIIYKFPDALFPVQLNIKSENLDLSLKVNEEVPDGMSILTSAPEADNSDSTFAEWYFDLLKDEEKTLLTINRLPSVSGFYEVYFNVEMKRNGIYLPLTKYIFGFELDFEKDYFINELIFRLIQLPADPEEMRYIEEIIGILESVNESEPVSKSDYENIMKELFTAKEKMEKIEGLNMYEYQKDLSVLILYYETRIEQININQRGYREH